ncbi:hypothetical protein V8J88_22165 [Massilia sp. W12]|uniref:hypothetical protein n=1 Tax=Massilia sp. W12 TaxID=3126507 RepID=UPI0030CCBB3C
MKIEVLHFGKDAGLEQNGGYLEIKDANSNQHLFFIKIYDIKYNPKKEDDVQDMFIIEMGVRDGVVRIKEEHGRVYAINLTERSAEMVYSPYESEKKIIKQNRKSQV